MARPSAEKITEITAAGITTQILAADAIYSVYYDGNPINIKTLSALKKTPAKYKKVAFSNAGHAWYLADRMNAHFNTNLFTVIKLTHGEIVERPRGITE